MKNIVFVYQQRNLSVPTDDGKITKRSNNESIKITGELRADVWRLQANVLTTSKLLTLGLPICVQLSF